MDRMRRAPNARPEKTARWRASRTGGTATTGAHKVAGRSVRSRPGPPGSRVRQPRVRAASSAPPHRRMGLSRRSAEPSIAEPDINETALLSATRCGNSVPKNRRSPRRVQKDRIRPIFSAQFSNAKSEKILTPKWSGYFCAKRRSATISSTGRRHTARARWMRLPSSAQTVGAPTWHRRTS